MRTFDLEWVAMITLRPFQNSDAQELQVLLNDKDVSRYLTSRVQYPYTIDQAEWWVDEGSHINPTWAILDGSNLVGCIGLEPGILDEAHVAEIGYWIGKPYWGTGYASAALAEITASTFRRGDTTRLTAGVFHPNNASMRVLEKCGYVLEGVFKNAYRKNGQYFHKHQYASVQSSQVQTDQG